MTENADRMKKKKNEDDGTRTKTKLYCQAVEWVEEKGGGETDSNVPVINELSSIKYGFLFGFAAAVEVKLDLYNLIESANGNSISRYVEIQPISQCTPSTRLLIVNNVFFLAFVLRILQQKT